MSAIKELGSKIANVVNNIKSIVDDITNINL
jgi:hypothetical protein